MCSSISHVLRLRGWCTASNIVPDVGLSGQDLEEGLRDASSVEVAARSTSAWLGVELIGLAAHGTVDVGLEHVSQGLNGGNDIRDAYAYTELITAEKGDGNVVALLNIFAQQVVSIADTMDSTEEGVGWCGTACGRACDGRRWYQSRARVQGCGKGGWGRDECCARCGNGGVGVEHRTCCSTTRGRVCRGGYAGRVGVNAAGSRGAKPS